MNFSIYATLLFLEYIPPLYPNVMYCCIGKTWDPLSLQQMRQEFKQRMEEAASSTQVEEDELPENEDMEVWSNSPPRIVQTHRQHLANYVRLVWKRELC